MSEQPIHSHLQVVTPVPEIPFFEGKPVDDIRLKVTSANTGLEIDEVLRMDDIIRVVIEARVGQVDHKVNERTGSLTRNQTARVISAALIPWDPNDPNDRGVLRG